MDTKRLPDERLDGLDAERFRDMLASTSFGLLRSRIAAELERAREACTTATERTDIHRAQGSAAALRAVLAMPKTILNEMEPKKTEVAPACGRKVQIHEPCTLLQKLRRER